MAEGNLIVVSQEPRGRRGEGVVDGALLPGICVQVKSGVEPDAGGRLTYEPYNAAVSGVPKEVIVLDMDDLQGKLATDAYVSGTRCKLYWPLPGDDLNMLIQDQSGTGATSDFAIGDPLMIEDGTGLLIDGTLGTLGYAQPFSVQETLTDLAADTLCHVKFTGQ